jgi:small subunit ribosomal protein S20
LGFVLILFVCLNAKTKFVTRLKTNKQDQNEIQKEEAEGKFERNSLKSSQRALTRTAVKAVTSAITAGDKQSASEAFKKAEKVLDTMANKKVIHANKASRTKSRLNKKIKAL